MSTAPNVTESTSRSKPKEKPADRLAAAIRGWMLEQRQAGTLPTTVEQIARELGETVPTVLKVLTKKVEPPEFCCVAKLASAPVTFAADVEPLFDSPGLLRFVADQARAKRTAKGKAPRGDVKTLVADSGVAKPHQALLRAALERRQAGGTMPAEIAELLALSPAQLADRLIETLTSPDRGTPPVVLGADALLERSRSGAKAAELKKALKESAFATACVTCVDPRSGETSYFLRSSLRSVAPILMGWAIEAALNRQPSLIGRSLGKKGKSNQFTADELSATVVKGKPLQLELAEAFESLAARNELGPAWAWLYQQGQRRFFRPGDVEPTAAVESSSVETSEDFAGAFERAFARLDHGSGGGNFVKVWELRRALSQFTSEQFEVGLRSLRSAGRFTMDSAHGGLVRLTDEELRAGIQEGSSLLVYVSRK